MGCPLSDDLIRIRACARHSYVSEKENQIRRGSVKAPRSRDCLGGVQTAAQNTKLMHGSSVLSQNLYRNQSSSSKSSSMIRLPQIAASRSRHRSVMMRKRESSKSCPPLGKLSREGILSVNGETSKRERSPAISHRARTLQLCSGPLFLRIDRVSTVVVLRCQFTLPINLDAGIGIYDHSTDRQQILFCGAIGLLLATGFLYAQQPPARPTFHTATDHDGLANVISR
jgi:hypothetical protein